MLMKIHRILASWEFFKNFEGTYRRPKAGLSESFEVDG